MKALVIADPHNPLATQKTMTAAAELTLAFEVFNPKMLPPLAETWVESLLPICNNYQAILTPATTTGKNFLPRLAAKLDVNPITDIIKILGNHTYQRPVYAGNAIETIQSFDKIQCLSIRPTAFAAYKNTVPEINVALTQTALPIKFIKQHLTESKRPELTNARIIVSGGRGLQSAEKFKLLEQLADKLGAAVGATRAAVDAGFVPNDYQVGQTGKIVAPEIYIAIGISGAIQHLAGMGESQIIIAINTDPDSPIFTVADYGLIGDCLNIIPELLEKL